MTFMERDRYPINKEGNKLGKNHNVLICFLAWVRICLQTHNFNNNNNNNKRRKFSYGAKIVSQRKLFPRGSQADSCLCTNQSPN